METLKQYHKLGDDDLQEMLRQSLESRGFADYW